MSFEIEGRPLDPTNADDVAEGATRGLEAALSEGYGEVIGYTDAQLWATREKGQPLEVTSYDEDGNPASAWKLRIVAERIES